MADRKDEGRKKKREKERKKSKEERKGERRRAKGEKEERGIREEGEEEEEMAGEEREGKFKQKGPSVPFPVTPLVTSFLSLGPHLLKFQLTVCSTTSLRPSSQT